MRYGRGSAANISFYWSYLQKLDSKVVKSHSLAFLGFERSAYVIFCCSTDEYATKGGNSTQPQKVYFQKGAPGFAGVAVEQFSNSCGITRDVQGGFFLRKNPLKGGGFPLHKLENCI
jgi:hypothetical protein